MRHRLALGELGTRLQWELARGWAALGVPELVALALLLLWAGLQVAVLAPLHAQSLRQAAQLETLQQAAQQTTRKGSQRQPVPNLRRDFLAFLLADGERERQLVKLHDLANHHHLQFSRAEYHSEPVADVPVTRMNVRLELQGAYADQRRFLHEAMDQLPNLAVSRLSLEKAGSGDSLGTVLEASLFYRNPSGETTP